MIILRLFLYLICALSIGWSAIIFCGPAIINRVISGYTDGALMPSGITLSPSLRININRLDFTLKNTKLENTVKGFSRATEISWALFGEKPFLDLKFGPTVLQDYASADNVHVYIPPVREIDWKNIFLHANINGLAFNSVVQTETIDFNGNLNLNSSTLSNVSGQAKMVFAETGKSTYAFDLIKGKLSDLNLNIPLEDQLFSGSFAVENITAVEPTLSASEATIEFASKRGNKNVKIDSHEVKFSDLDGFVTSIQFDGNYDQRNVLQDVKIDFLAGVFNEKLPDFSNISTKIVKTGAEIYKANIEGNLAKFEISNSGNFLGSMPPSNFVIEAELDGSASTVTAKSKIKFDRLGMIGIYGSLAMQIRSEQLASMKCAFRDCEVSDLNLSYQINLSDEWITGSAVCPETYCNIGAINYFLRTSDTVKVFTILNQENILSPLSSLYLYGAISAGQKINSGHEIKFQF